MISFTEYERTDEDIDKFKLGIIKLMFDTGLRLESGEFVNNRDGSKDISIRFVPYECENKGDVE